MSDHDKDVLTSITKTLIDSREGYATLCDVTADSHDLAAEFARRRSERDELISEFQAALVASGGESQTSGSAKGAVHRAFTRFTALFQDDIKAAASALDDGEEYLVEKIEDRLEDSSLSNNTRVLLQKALVSARSGEYFADGLDD